MVDPDFGDSSGAVDFGSFLLPLYRPGEHGEVAPEDLGLDPLRREELLREKRENESEPKPPKPEAEPKPQ
jgi:hypothetical protein